MEIEPTTSHTLVPLHHDWPYYNYLIKKIVFQIPDDICEALTNRTQLNSELIYSKQEAHDTLCNTCNVTPYDAPKGVQAQKVLHPDKDVFLLKIGKQTDEPNRTGNIEVVIYIEMSALRFFTIITRIYCLNSGYRVLQNS